jgi:diguanylate cyclase (GGDEF)-like protein/PAS domain S-box-containing protein
VAILNLQGMVIQFNPYYLGVFGYPADRPVTGRPFSDFLVPEDVAAAKDNMNRALYGNLDPLHRYVIRSASGTAQGLATPGQVGLECTGDPLVIAVFLDQNCFQPVPGSSEAERWLGPDPQRDCILSAEGVMLYVGKSVEEALAEHEPSLIGKSFDRYVSRRSLASYHNLQKVLRNSQPGSADLIMQPKSGDHVTLRMTAWPILTQDHQLNSIILATQDITELMALETALQHRMKLEKAITEISKRFVAVPADEMDKTIESVLGWIAESEEVAESALEIFKSATISIPARYRAQPVSAIQTSTENLERYENISVPIQVAEERLGCFHFSLVKFQGSWLEEDLPLISLIGEIIVNALIRKENELSIRINEKRLATTLQSIVDAVIATDTAGLVISMNRSAEKLTGWTQAEAHRRLLSDVMQTNRAIGTFVYNAPLLSSNGKTDTADAEKTVRLWSRDGSFYYISISSSVITDQDGVVYGEVIVFRDITREKEEADEIRYISYHDSLTGLYNRTFFEEELRRLNSRRQYPITLILGDCNGLKIANDIFGHLEGDHLLIAIADILRKATRQEDIVARWGGDEFAIILPRTDESAAAKVRERVLRLCDEAEAAPIRPSLALGSATNTDGSSNMEALLKLAEDRMYRHKLMEGKSARNAILQSIKKMLYEKSYETEEHAGRMIEIAHLFGHHIGLSIDELEELSLLAVLHDMGKIGIPDSILRKTGRLSAEEWMIMKKHPEKGYNIAKSTPELSGIAQLILHHHERWDGTGYPSGLKGDKIPKLSRVLSIIDAYDVITHNRTYKSAQSDRDALLEIERCAGSQFDPELANAFINVMKTKLVADTASASYAHDRLTSAVL